jgi:hypothetical protein
MNKQIKTGISAQDEADGAALYRQWIAEDEASADQVVRRMTRPVVSAEARALYEAMMREAAAYTDALVAGGSPEECAAAAYIGA